MKAFETAATLASAAALTYLAGLPALALAEGVLAASFAAWWLGEVVGRKLCG